MQCLTVHLNLIRLPDQINYSAKKYGGLQNHCFIGLLLTKSGLNDIDDSLAGVDVGEDLATARRIFSSFLKDDDLRLLSKKKQNVKVHGFLSDFIYGRKFLIVFQVRS